MKNTSLEDYIKTIDKSDCAILIENLQGKIELVNDKFCQIFAYDKDEILKLKQSALVHPDDEDTIIKYHKNQMENKFTIPSDMLFRGIKKDGSSIDARILSLPRFDEDKNLLGTINFFWDLSNFKNLEENLIKCENELIHSEIELQAILESTAEGILIVADDGKVLKTNKNFAKLWKIPNKVLQSEDDDTILSFVLDQLEDPKSFLSKVQKLYNSKNKDFDTIRFKDGRIFERYSKPLLLGEKSIGRIWSFSDITEKSETEKALQQSEQVFRSLIENSPIIIMRLEKDGIISFINFEYAGHKPIELIGKKLYEFVPPEFQEIAETTIEKVFETKQTLSFENIEQTESDNVKWLRNNISPVIDNGVVVSANMMSMDITELKQLDIMRNEFVASVSHELRTPLTIVRESLSLMESGIVGELNSDQLEIVTPSLGEIDRLTRIINNLLDITKMDGEKIELELEKVDIIDLSRSVLNSFQVKASSKSLSLEFNTKLKELTLYCDRDRIIQVFINLIGNAVKFTQSGFVRVIITEENNDIMCTIADSGDGISDEDLGTVFDRFHQVSKINRAGESGSGLGLTISKGIVKLHGGKIWVKSKIRVGSEFYFTLPKITTEQFVEQNIDKIIDESRSSHTKTTLLLLRIDNYDKLSKKFSHGSIDQLRDRIFRKIEEEVAMGDFIHRLSDNEFILISNITKQNMKIMTSKIKSVINEVLDKYDEEFTVEMSSGVSVFPTDGNDSKALVEFALKQLK
jgi:PAS domain S-box-containing protein/diguanylate cyclase (GGDEF)-like protein